MGRCLGKGKWDWCDGRKNLVIICVNGTGQKIKMEKAS